MAFVSEKPRGESEKWRVIDYERDIVLKRTGGVPQVPGDIFSLKWGD